jgi:hypothetical protein
MSGPPHARVTRKFPHCTPCQPAVRTGSTPALLWSVEEVYDRLPSTPISCCRVSFSGPLTV